MNKAVEALQQKGLDNQQLVKDYTPDVLATMIEDLSIELFEVEHDGAIVFSKPGVAQALMDIDPTLADAYRDKLVAPF